MSENVLSATAMVACIQVYGGVHALDENACYSLDIQFVVRVSDMSALLR